MKHTWSMLGARPLKVFANDQKVYPFYRIFRKNGRVDVYSGYNNELGVWTWVWVDSYWLNEGASLAVLR